MYVSSSYMELDPAFGISIEQEIDWEVGWMVSKPECTRTKLSSHLPPKWPGLSGSS